ncbi:N-acetylaspartate synthetase-like [Eucyclogobius newberryi]|uniref:N-acetylaspartate synthetase-like n=1 Tax=Eucyclogobius newberryi TaxID=166745 RepID=UPI003B5B9CA6
MEEMVTDTAFKGLRHHPESLLMYLAITVSFLWMSMCSWMIVLLPVAILYGRYFYSFRAMSRYKKHALNTDMADIQGSYIKASGSCLWVALVDSAVVGLVAAVQRSSDMVELKRMAVDRRHRCRGVGMALGRKVLEFALSQKLSKVILGTTNYTPAAHNLYRRLGFQRVNATNGYYIDGPSLLERLFYRVRHHHYELEVHHKENNTRRC